MRQRSLRQAVATRALFWASRILGMGGLLLAVVGGEEALRSRGGALSAFVPVIAGLAFFGLGVYMGGRFLAIRDHTPMRANLPLVAMFDAIGSAGMLLGWMSVPDAGSEGAEAGHEAEQNFAATLVDPVEIAALLGVATVRVNSAGITTSHISTTRLSAVDARGRVVPPALSVTVVQGQRVAQGRGQWRGQGVAIPGVGEDAWLTASDVSVRRGDTMIRIHIQGYAGDTGPLLSQLAASADRRLTAGAPALTA
ncbi:MAG: hypothetical protein NVSMB17_12360 [Candidatus Dormibacteria bacterium]